MAGRLVELDVDGVLANIHCGLNPYVQSILPGFDGDTHIMTYDMQELNKIDVRLRTTIFSLFTDPEFIGSLELFPGTLEALIDLDAHLKSTGDKMGINSLLCSESAMHSRKDWLERVIRAAGIDFKTNVGCSRQKEVLDSFVTVEDNVDNLIRSTAPIKILIRRGHNRSAKVSDFGACEHMYFCDTFVEAVEIIKRLVK